MKSEARNKAKNMQMRPNEKQLGMKEQTRASEANRHTMLRLSSAGNKGNVSLHTTHGSTHG